ncbi:DOMON-like domain-containing protein [Blastomonas sp.]|uniref:DOMON-like domain-containing protein n=1 Tax=Blastomonas sp. TaxID=1909299 RepID=UPI00260F43D5|nr:DOMON-like domain-containing protein [Blastomonas sp.]MDM7955614.1 DOMON-like domain-containing protein [Blastomonas sp.]
MKSHILVSHPDCPLPAIVEVAVGWTLDAEALALEFRVSDPHHTILWPAPASGRTDGLWQNTCFEAFIGSATGSAYAEVNLSPSGAWAAYAFDDYRSGMRDLNLATPPQIAHTASNRWHATLDLTGLSDLIGPAPWRLAVTAVIEARDGSKSYWSLAHPPGKPNFHHADCFAARLG